MGALQNMTVDYNRGPGQSVQYKISVHMGRHVE